MQWIQEFLTLYSVSLLVASVILFGSMPCGPRLAIEKTKAFIVPRVMEMGGNSGVSGKRHPSQKKMGKKDRKNREANNPTRMALMLQPRRRSGRLTKLYWKDLSGISSETNPIILDSDSSDAEEEEKKCVEAAHNEDMIKKNKEETTERNISEHVIGKEGLQGLRKGTEAVGRRKLINQSWVVSGRQATGSVSSCQFPNFG